MSIKAAKAFEAAGAIVTEVAGVMTREMLDGLDHFWRARRGKIFRSSRPDERGKALPYIYKWAESGAKLSGVEVDQGL